MSVPRVRPTFELVAPTPVEDAMDRLRVSLSGPDPPWCGMTARRHAELFVPECARHAWSPWLSVEVSDHDRGGCHVRGRFSPHPHVWTLYMFLWFAIGFGALVGASWGYAQWAMDTTPWALASLPAAAGAGIALYVVSLVGQRLGSQQMQELRGTLESLIQ